MTVKENCQVTVDTAYYNETSNSSSHKEKACLLVFLILQVCSKILSVDFKFVCNIPVNRHL